MDQGHIVISLLQHIHQLSGGVNDKGSNSVTALLHDSFYCICIYLLYVFILSVLNGINAESLILL